MNFPTTPRAAASYFGSAFDARRPALIPPHGMKPSEYARVVCARMEENGQKRRDEAKRRGITWYPAKASPAVKSATLKIIEIEVSRAGFVRQNTGRP